MCADNKVRLEGEQSQGLYSCENPLTLQRDLKQRMNFSGFVCSDCEPEHHHSHTFAHVHEQSAKRGDCLQTAGCSRSRCGPGWTKKCRGLRT